MKVLANRRHQPGELGVVQNVGVPPPKCSCVLPAHTASIVCACKASSFRHNPGMYLLWAILVITLLQAQ